MSETRKVMTQAQTTEDAVLSLCQDELCAIGWQFDLLKEDQPLRQFDATTMTMGERATTANLPVGSDEYLRIKPIVHRLVSRYVVDQMDLQSQQVPSADDVGSEHSSRAKSELWWSEGALNQETLVVLINGQSDCEGPFWNERACIYHGLRVGSTVRYVQEARNRGWGVVICNPNRNGEIMNAQDDDQQCGPAPAAIVEGIADFGWGPIAAHRSCLGSKTTNLERCGNWIFNQIDSPELLTTELSDAEARLRVVPIPHNDSPVSHVQYVWDAFLSSSKAKTIHFVAFSYGGYAMTKLIQARAEELEGRLGGIAMADSSHIIDFVGELDKRSSSMLQSRARNWIPSPEEVGVPLSDERLCVPCFSAGDCEHCFVAGLVAELAMAFLDVLHSATSQEAAQPTATGSER